MSLLTALKLPTVPPAPPPAQPEPGVRGRDDAAFEQARKLRDGMKDQLEKGWREAVEIGKTLDANTRKTFVAQLQEVDKKRQEARRLDGDPPGQVVVMAAALMGLKQARQAVGKPVSDGTDANTAYESADGVSVEKPTSTPPAPPPPVVAKKEAVAPRDPKQQAEVAKARTAAQQKYEALYDAHAKLEAEQAALKKRIAAEKGVSRKKELEEAKSELDEKVEVAEHRRKTAQEDVETLRDPRARPDAIAKAIARTTGGDVAETTTVARPKDGLKPGEKKTETTTSKVEKGTATVAKTTDSLTYGADGVTGSRKIETEKTSAEGTSRKSEELTANVSAEGVKVEHKQGSEFENRDGKKLAIEKEKSLDVGSGGIKGSSTTTVTKRDGSSEAIGVSGGVERGDGKAAAVVGGSYTKTDASGNETSVSGGQKRGVVSGEDGTGVMAENSAGYAKQNKSGFKTNATLKFGGNISCKVGDKDAKTGLYPVTLTVQFAATAGTGTGYGKKSGKSAVSVDAKLAAAATMRVTNHLPEDKVQVYVDSLGAAASGSKLDATWNELAIVYTGAQQTWDVAKRMYLEGGDAVGDKEGDSTETADEYDLSVGGKGNLRAVKVEGSVQRGGKSSTKTTRTKSGGLEIDRQQEESEGVAYGGGVDTGITGMMVRGGFEMKTSIGFLVTIEQADDPKGELRKAFLACKTGPQQKAFIDAHKDKVKLKEMTQGKKEGSSSGVEGSLGGVAKLKIGSKGSTARETRTDADGKLIQSKVVGEQDSDVGAGIGDLINATESRKTTATSVRDGEGNVSLDLADENKSSNLLARAGKRLKGMFGLEDAPEEKKKQTGLIADVAGSKEEEEFDREVYGVHIGKEDVARIVARAKGNAQEWSQMCWLAVDEKGIKQWSALRDQIASKGAADPGFVTDQLAAFIGVDQGRRMDVLMRLVRPGGDTGTGKRSEFPKSIQEHAKAYAELVVRGNLADAVAKKAKAEGKEAAGNWGGEQFKRLEKMLVAVRLAEDFRDKATQLEMMAAINDAKSALLKAVRHETGNDDAKAEADAARHDYQRIVLELTKFPEVVNPRLAEMKKLLGSRNRLYNDNREEGFKLIEDLANAFDNWKREYGKCEKLGKSLGAPEPEYVKYRPDLSAYEEMRKAAGL
jgi:hypothetical protein